MKEINMVECDEFDHVIEMWSGSYFDNAPPFTRVVTLGEIKHSVEGQKWTARYDGNIMRAVHEEETVVVERGNYHAILRHTTHHGDDERITMMKVVW